MSVLRQGAGPPEALVDVAPRPELRPESRPDARLESRNVEPRHGDANGVSPNQASTNAAETVAVATAPPPVPEEAKAPAPLAGFLPFHLTGQEVSPAEPVKGETELLTQVTAALPARAAGASAEAHAYKLASGEPVSMELSNRLRDCEAGPRERGLEIRDFVRGLPMVELDLRGASETSLDRAEQTVQMQFGATPPEGLGAPYWEESPREFAVSRIELGELARLAFAPAALQDDALEPAPTPAIESGAEVAAAPPEQAVETTIETAVETAAENTIEAALEAATVEAPVPVEAAPEPPPEPTPEPVLEHVAPEIVPELVRRPLPLTLHGLAAGRGKPVQIFTAAVAGGVCVQMPRSNGLPLRPLMILAPIADAKPPELKPEEEFAPAKSDQVKPEPIQTEPAKPEIPADLAKPDLGADTKRTAPPAKVDPRVANAKNRRPGVRVISPEDSVIKAVPVVAGPSKAEASKPESVRAEPPAPSKIALPKVAPPKVEELRPAAAAAAVVLPKVETRQDAKPTPITSQLTTADLGLPRLDMSGSGAVSGKLKIGIAAGIALALAGAALFLVKGNGSPAHAGTGTPHVVEAGPALPVGDGGWVTNWSGGEAGVRRTRDISILRASTNLTDYRVEFQAQIETKGLGWVVRAMNPKNFYVMKLEVLKPGLQPTVNFVHFAVVNGEEQGRTQLPLGFPVRVDTMYRIRTEVVGNHITTWLQDQKIDDWTDERVKTGGTGLYYDRGERGSLKGGLNVVPLTLKN